MDSADYEIGGFGYYVAGLPNELVIMHLLPKLLDTANETDGLNPSDEFESLSLLDSLRLVNRGWSVLISSTIMWASLRLARLDFWNRSRRYQFRIGALNCFRQSLSLLSQRSELRTRIQPVENLIACFPLMSDMELHMLRWHLLAASDDSLRGSAPHPRQIYIPPPPTLLLTGEDLDAHRLRELQR